MKKILLLIFTIPSFVSAQWSIYSNKDDSVSTTSEDWDLKMISDNKGGAILCWHDWRTESQEKIFAQRIDNKGIARWTLNGSDISPLKDMPLNDFTVMSNLKSGMFIFYNPENQFSYIDTPMYLEDVDSNGIINWDINLSQSFDAKWVDGTADGKGGIYLLFSPLLKDTDYFVHIDSRGVDITPNGVPIVMTSNDGHSIGKIILIDSSRILISSFRSDGEDFICCVDTSGTVVSSTSINAGEVIELLQKGLNHDAYMIATDGGANIFVYRIIIDSSLTVKYIGEDYYDCGYNDSYVALNQFIESDTDHIYMIYDFGYCDNYDHLMEFNESGSFIKKMHLTNYSFSSCSDEEGGFYSAENNQIYHFNKSDTNYSEVNTYSNLGQTYSPQIISDGDEGCLIGFTKFPICNSNNSNPNTFNKRYPKPGIDDSLPPIITCFGTYLLCGYKDITLSTNATSTSAEFYWYDDGHLLDSSSVNQITLHLNNPDTIEYFQCIIKSSVGRDTSSIIAQPIYPEPILSFINDTLKVAAWGATAYQWHESQDPNLWDENNTEIVGATNSTYVPTSSGYYSCMVSFPEGCGAGPNPIHVSLTFSQNAGAVPKVNVFPNPTSGQVNINLPGDQAKIVVMNEQGVKLFEAKTTNTQYLINLSNYPDGIYFIDITLSGEFHLATMEKEDE